ncbi:DEAD/DEAH box helicase family protein [Mycoplasma sp. 2575]
MNNNLADKLKNILDYFPPKDLDTFIVNGLNPKIKLRDYQTRAIQSFILYYLDEGNTKLRTQDKIHNLFQMATGSGKTVIMAALILFLYQQGYRNFIFFVSQTNILEKTKENFANPASSKYLFASPLKCFNKTIKINIVDNFQASNIDKDSINICFTTIQKLHNDIISPRENAMSEYDFSNHKVVFISDESHHLNASTKAKSKVQKPEIFEEPSWENTVISLYNKHPESLLLEFSATAGLNNEDINKKYADKLIFDYPLKTFRDEKWTKNFQNISSETTYWQRSLIALIISEYRHMLFNDLGLEIKPVVLFKSKTIVESKKFFEEFKEKIQKLSIEDIIALETIDIPIMKQSLSYFKNLGHQDYQLLVNLLKESFREQTLVIINSSTESAIDAQTQVLLNTLEDKDNVLRGIFVVDQLNEGWDVLNLFDIVRLHDERQENTRVKTNKYTIKEAQLIGRGARYCPFVYNNDEQNRNKRKFDADLSNKYRVLETLYYHCKNDSRYINDLQNTLKQTGLIDDDNGKVVEIKLKEEFKNSEFFQNALVWTNKRVPKQNSMPSEQDKVNFTKTIDFKIRQIKANEEKLFDLDTQSDNEIEELKIVQQLNLQDVEYHILEGCALYFETLKFDFLKSKFSNLKSLQEFLTSSDYLGSNVKIIFKSNDSKAKISGRDIFSAVMDAFKQIENYLYSLKDASVGEKVLRPKYLKDVIEDKLIYVANVEDEDGNGNPQSKASDKLRMDLSSKKWYVFNENYGTSEEKEFVKWFSDNYAKRLENKNIEFYLVRNERFSDLALYDFDSGDRFEPDFLLYFKTNKISSQVFVEPKGTHLIEHDNWKANLLSLINSDINLMPNNGNWRVIGMPFFNKLKTTEFSQKFDDFIESL